MAHAHWMLDAYGYEYTFGIGNTYFFSIATMFARKCVNVTLYVHLLSCYNSPWKKERKKERKKRIYIYIMSKKQSYRMVWQGTSILTQLPVTYKKNHTIRRHIILNSAFPSPFARWVISGASGGFRKALIVSRKQWHHKDPLAIRCSIAPQLVLSWNPSH